MTNRNQPTEGAETPEVDPQQLGIEDALDDPTPDPTPHPAAGPTPDPLEDEPPAEVTVEELALLVADLDESEREQLVQALAVLVGDAEEPISRDGLKAGDYVELKGHAFVQFPDGTVVTASRQLVVGQPGEYAVTYWGKGQGEESFTVAEKDDEA